MKKFDKIASGIILLVVLSEILVSFSLIGFERVGCFQFIEVLTWILFSNFLLGWCFMFGGFWTLFAKMIQPIYVIGVPYQFSYVYLKTGYVYRFFAFSDGFQFQ
jgi:hypothetical protein